MSHVSLNCKKYLVSKPNSLGNGVHLLHSCLMVLFMCCLKLKTL